MKRVMPRTKRNDSVRINLEVAPAVRDRLERLKETAELESITEAIRRALAIYEKILELNRDGDEVVIRFRDGTEKPLLIIP